MPENNQGNNWKRYIPAAMAAFAGAMDPRHSGQIAQGGWNQVNRRLQQQRMQQQQEQFDEQMNRQNSMLKIYQSQEDRLRKDHELKMLEKDDEAFMFEHMGEYLSTVDMDAATPASGIQWYRKKAEEVGHKFSANAFKVFNAVWDNSAFVPHKDGPGVITMQDGKPTLVVPYKVGKQTKYKKFDLDNMTPEQFGMLKEAAREGLPETRVALGDYLIQSGKAPDEGRILKAAGERELAASQAKAAGVSKEDFGRYDRKIKARTKFWDNREAAIRAKYFTALGVNAWANKAPKDTDEANMEFAAEGDKALADMYAAREKDMAKLTSQLGGGPAPQPGGDGGGTTIPPDLAAAGLTPDMVASGITPEDIRYTMEKHGLTAAEVIEVVKKRRGAAQAPPPPTVQDKVRMPMPPRPMPQGAPAAGVMQGAPPPSSNIMQPAGHPPIGFFRPPGR